MTGEIKDISIDYLTNKPQIILTLNERESLLSLENLKGNKLSIDIKKWRKKRSLDANNYFWKLLRTYAEEKEVDAIEEYKERVKRLGIFRVSRIETKDVETYKKSWENWGTAWFCEIYDTEYLGDIEFKILHLYYGSSSFNSKQMSRLINDLVEDCKEVGIETKPKEEIESLLRSWK
jgi:hypothetical protein